MKFVINTLEEVAEPLRGEYEARNGKFYLKTEGDFAPLVESNTKLVEFRDNNRSLNSIKLELETKLKTFEGIDPVEHGKLKTKISELEAKGVKGTDDVVAQIKTAVAAAVAPLEAREIARAASEKAAVERADRELLKSTLTAAGVKAGVDERALSDYVNRGAEIFKVVNGQVVARKGEAPIFSKAKPAELLTPDEFAVELQGEAPHLFKPSRGGGAGGSGGGGGPVVKKTISADPMEFGRNLEGIAKGEVTVSQ